MLLSFLHAVHILLLSLGFTINCRIHSFELALQGSHYASGTYCLPLHYTGSTVLPLWQLWQAHIGLLCEVLLVLWAQVQGGHFVVSVLFHTYSSWETCKPMSVCVRVPVEYFNEHVHLSMISVWLCTCSTFILCVCGLCFMIVIIIVLFWTEWSCLSTLLSLEVKG